MKTNYEDYGPQGVCRQKITLAAALILLLASLIDHTALHRRKRR